MKIPRNNPCPCGSGKKYKRCCFLGTKGSRIVAQNTIIEPLYSREQIETLTMLSALQIFPENGIHLEGLQRRILNFLKVRETAKGLTYENFLTSIFWENHIKGASLNKPDVFSTTITSIIGNVTVLPGLLKGGGLLLQAILNVLFLDQRNKFAQEFYHKAYAATFFILKIADHLAKENRILPFDEGYIELESVFLPGKEVLEGYSASCFLNRSAIEISLTSRNLPIGFIDDFIIGSKHLPDNFDENNPFLFRPLLELQKVLIILCPGNLLSALYFYLWKLAVRHNCSEQVSRLYNFELRLMVKRSVFHLGWKWVKKAALSVDDENIMVFHMDIDKLAVVIYCPDEVSPQNFTMEDPIQRAGDPAIGAYVKMQIEKLNTILDESEFSDKKRLIITVIGNSGRQAKALIDIPEHPFLIFNYQDWLTLCHGGEDYHPLTLWYFYLARERFLQQYDTPGVSLLDLFVLYHNHKESFYLSNQALEKYSIDPVVTYAFLRAAEKKVATKVLPYRETGNSQINFIPVLLLDEYDQVFISDPVTGIGHHLAITGFPQTIWFKPQTEESYSEYNATDKGFFQELIKMAAYWFNQSKSDIKPVLETWGSETIEVEVNISDPERFFNPITESKEFDKDHQPVYISLTSSGLLLDFNSAFSELLDWGDNRGERYFVSKLLTVFHEGTVLENDIQQVVDRIAPLGRKKKLTILNAVTDIRLLGDHLGKAKYLSWYQTNRVLDELTIGLEDDFLMSLPELIEKQEKLRFLSSLIFETLIPKLRDALNGVNSAALLASLIGKYEAIVYRKKAQELRVPTVKYCYPEFYELFIEKVQHINRESQEAAIAYRCLIEFVSAEQQSGQTKISQELVDELLAIMGTIIDLGIMNDELYFDLSNDNLAILASGRIGFQHQFRDSIIQPYQQQKLDQQLEQFHEDFDDFFSKNEGYKHKGSEELLTNINDAYHTAYGFTFQNIIHFLVDVSDAGSRQNQSCAHFLRKELIEVAINKQKDLTEGQAGSILDLLSQVSRGNALKVPKGLDNYEASPWRYNRILSYLSKPFVVTLNVELTDNPTIYFGPRHLMDVAENMEIILAEGRLRDERLKSLNSHLLDQKGKRFNAVVAKWFKEHTTFQVFPEVKLPDRLGDIDVVLIDKMTMRIYLAEAKNTSAAKVAKEMAEERDRFLIGDEKERGWIEKHLIRFQALSADPSILGNRLNMDLNHYKLVPFLITSHSLLIPYLLNTDKFDPKFNMPIIAFSSLKASGVDMLQTFTYEV